MHDLAVVILGAGLGKRMKASFPKVLQEINKKTLIEFVLDSCRALNPARILVVVGYKADQVIERLGKNPHFYGMPLQFVHQEEQLGTAHAVSRCYEKLKGFTGQVLVLCGDVPFIKPETLRAMLKLHQNSMAEATLLTTDLPDPAGYGRVIRGEEGAVLRIVEHKDANERELEIREINSGTYLFNNPDLFEKLKLINNHNSQGEYYITDLIRLFREENKRVSALKVIDYLEVMGINSPEQREIAEGYYRKLIS
ncbi:NTP transferase domain-containing protein [bacterium]|nr:NTP transferase domain-containing protein [bacterium]